MVRDDLGFDFAPENRRPDGMSLGVLCVHGFTGTPFEMRYLGQSLSRRGMRALGPLLPGHGTSPDDLDRTTWSDWYGAVSAGFDELRASCDRVAVVGQSLGGLLALHLARERGAELTAVASLAAPLWLGRLPTAVLAATSPATRTGRLLARMLPKLPKLSRSDTRDKEMRARNPSYRMVPVRALHQLVTFMQLVRRDLHHIATPALIMHAPRDHTAPPACAHEIAARVQRGRLSLLEHSFHNIAIDVERERVATEVAEFIGANTSTPDQEAES